jgi:pimeloyl-ACP methyl ester carboxylesterase
MSAIILQDEIVHYEVLGRGRPLIFIHGWVGSWRYWIPSMQAASINFRAYALDLWGFGGTAKEPGKYLLNQQAALLADFRSEMGIPKIALVGHGLGAIVALMFAKDNPQFVDRVMAICLPLNSSDINPRLQQSPPSELADWLLGNTPDAQVARMEAAKADQDAILRSLHNLQNIEITQLAASITTPSLLVFGQNDPAVSLTNNDHLANLPERVHYIVFDNSGHFPMIDEVNKFNRLMIDFLNLPSGESPRQLQLKEEWKRRIR